VTRQTNSALGTLTPGSDLDEFDIITNRSKSAQQVSSSPVNDMLNKQNNNNLNDLLAEMDPLSANQQPSISPQQQQSKPKVNNPAAFLGENSALVNLDNLIKPINTNSNNNAYNPFESPALRTKNLFQQNQPQVSGKFNIKENFNEMISILESVHQSTETTTAVCIFKSRSMGAS
jgi:epsin